MAHMNVFTSDAFSMAELTDAFTKVAYLPSMIRSMNLFAVRRVRTPFVSIESRGGLINVIQTTPRGEPINREKAAIKREMRQFATARIADSAVITADEIAGIREFGSETELKQVISEMADRTTGPLGILRNFEATWERMQLGAVQGIVTDADDSVLYNWFTEFGINQPAEIDFDLDNGTPASGAVKKVCNTVIRGMKRAAQGAWVEGSTYVVALCGDAFWDDLTAHSEVRGTYLNTQEAADLRNNLSAFDSFVYGGIRWVNYRGTDDNSTIAVGTDKAKFFPVNAPGAFVAAYSPGEFFGQVNRPGPDLVARTVIDPDAQGKMDEARWAAMELYSYPMYICTRPGMLWRGKRT